MLQKGTHFSQGRFFPVEYVLEILKKIISAAAQTDDAKNPPIPEELLQDDTPIEDIVEYFSKTYGIDAETMRLQFVERFEKNYNKYQNWKPENFDFVGTHDEASGGKLVVVERRRNRSSNSRPDGDDDSSSTNNKKSKVVHDEDIDIMKLVNDDKMTLQNYGRPYNPETGKPTGKYYSYPATDIEKDIDFW